MEGKFLKGILRKELLRREIRLYGRSSLKGRSLGKSPDTKL